MKLDRLALVTVFALGAAACGHDRSQEVKSAQTDLSSAQQEALNEQSRLHQQQAHAQHQPMSAEQRAELERHQAEERAETIAEGRRNVAEAHEDLSKAQASLEAERAKTEADAKERLRKAEAKVMEAQNKSGRLSTAKRTKLASDLSAFNGKKAEVESRLSSLSQSTEHDFKDAKAKLDKSLDDLESVADRVEGDL